MNEAVRLILVGLAAGVTLVALFLSVGVLFGRKVERARRAAEESPGRAFVVGAINILFLSALGFGFSALADAVGAEVLQLPALLFFSLLIILLAFGLTATSMLVGERLFPGAGLFRSRLGGAGLLTLASLAPFVGWFGFLPYVAFLGSGGFILGLFRGAGGPNHQGEPREAEDLLE